jgi:membrane fusion protein, multidrug efflux system
MMRSMQRPYAAGFQRLLRGGSLLLLIVATLAGGAGCGNKSGKNAHAGGGGGFKMPPMPVETAVASAGTVSDRFEAVGTIEAGTAITVVAQIDGIITSLPFREGEPIRRGGLIAQLDDTQLAAEVARAEAVRDQSRATYERVKEVVAQNAGAPQDLDDAAAALRVAEANLNVAQARLDKTRITAPFDGIAGARQTSPGAYLRPGDPITNLAQVRTIRVNFAAPERYMSKLDRGSEVTLTTTAYSGLELHGRIAVIEPVLDPATRNAHIIATADNPEEKFRPGMSVNVSAVLSERQNAVTIPNEAVFFEGDQSLVYLVKPDSTVSRTPLTLGTRQSETVEVLKGLAPGDRVVRAGHQKLFEGARVIPIMSQGVAAQTRAGASATGSDGTKSSGGGPSKSGTEPLSGEKR